MGPQDAILDYLKRRDSAPVAELAEMLGVTRVGARQHLQAMESAGLVSQVMAEPEGRGRPAALWSLTPAADARFADRHGDLTVDLIQSIRSVVGQEGLERVLAERAGRQRAAYLAKVGETPVAIRASKLARIRSSEGYMVEVSSAEDGSFLLVEHHCPVCEAAKTCETLCAGELATFETVFDGVATVERETHLMAGDRRCTYRITPTAGS